MIFRKLCLLAAGAALSLSVSAIAATTTFAQFTQVNSTKVVSNSATSNSNSLTVTNAPVYFVIQAFGPVGIYSAFLNIAATSTAMVTNTGPQFEQVGWSGTYSFTNGSTNFLTVAFVGAISDINGDGGSGSNFASDPGSSIAFTSDVINVSMFSIKDFALAFSAITPPYGIDTNGYGTPFTANIAGTFAGEVPEPASWAMLLIGFGLIGATTRNRRLRRQTVAA